MRNVIAAAVLSSVLVAGAARAEEEAPEIPWGPLNALVGSWIGHETGKAGIGKGARTYRMILDDRYVFAENLSRFEPQEKNPQGETHRDWAIFSYDRGRERLVLREFHSESFVIEYVQEGEIDSRGQLVFVSERVENAPAGTRARYTLAPTEDGGFRERFELAFPGRELETFLENRWRRE